ncbi:alpha/beta fold hydrolase [Streptomyces hydrogenans]
MPAAGRGSLDHSGFFDRAISVGSGPVEPGGRRGAAGAGWAGASSRNYRSSVHVRVIIDEVERLDLREVVLVGHSYSGIPVGQAAERVGDRLAGVVFVDSSVPADGEAFASSWPDGGAMLRASLAENGGFWPVAPATHFEDHGLTDEQIARIVRGSTPHPGATLTEPAVLKRPLDHLPATYIKCTLGDPEPSDDVAKLLGGEDWRLVEMDTGHWPMFSQPRELAQLLLDAVGE